MSDTITGDAVRGPDRFDQVEALFARYPELSEAELADLKHWFRKEASAFEVATFAGKDATSVGYRRFRADHIDGLSARDLVVAVGLLAMVAAVVGMIWVLTP